MTFQQCVQDIQKGKIKPVYVLAGEEPFQVQEIVDALKSKLRSGDDSFNLENFDMDTSDFSELASHLETDFGSLFQEKRLFICRDFGRFSSQAEKLIPYFENPNENQCVVLEVAKADKKKKWVKASDSQKYLVEVSDPYERDFPKWQSHFEGKINKKIHPEAWTLLAFHSQLKLALLWADLQTLALYLHDRDIIQPEDVRSYYSKFGSADVVAFIDDVIFGNQTNAFLKWQELQFHGESDVKILALVLRQFKIVEQCQALLKKGQEDPKELASHLGVHSFFVPKIIKQSKNLTHKKVQDSMRLLCECDFKIKTGAGQFFEDFMVPYFSKAK